MQISTIWSVYFSATGVTERVVSAVADAAAEALCGTEQENLSGRPDRKDPSVSREQRPQRKMLCFNPPDVRQKPLIFGKNDLVILGVPVYAGRVPNLLLPYLKEKVKGGVTPAVAVVTYGNRNFDDALAELCGIMEENGFYIAAAGAFVGEHAFSRVLGAGRPDEADLSLAEMLGRRAAEFLLKGLSFSVSGPDCATVPAPVRERVPVSVRVPGHYPPGPYYTPRDRNGNPIDIRKVKPKVDERKCMRCGLCAVLCPLGSIDIDNVTEVTGICMKCGACVKKCPSGARYFDDPGYLYHKSEREEIYARRAESRIFSEIPENPDEEKMQKETEPE